MFDWFTNKPAAIDDPLNLDRALDCYRRGAYREALRRADAILDSGREVALSWRFKGECLFSLERYAEAAKCFEQSESIGGPGTEDAFLWRALSLYNGGQRELAKQVVCRFLASDNKNGELVAQAENALREFGVTT
jgi:tetratricopeptide (TPR) repeat protein